MIREERDPAFWERVARHPACADAMMGIEPSVFAAHAVTEGVLPLAAEHGGFIFVPRDAFNRTVELHTIFTPEGWGREAASAAKEALGVVFDRFDLIVTYERVGDWRTRPPRSFGFRPCAERSFDSHGGTWRLWSLSKENWILSPVLKRMVR